MNSNDTNSPFSQNAAQGNRSMKIATKFIHAGSEPDPSTGAIMTPIYQTSTYVQEAPGKNKGYEYARSQNPTRKALEDAYAIIENAKYGLAFGSGVAAPAVFDIAAMAAISLIFIKGLVGVSIQINFVFAVTAACTFAARVVST